jgi:hypothetical protein
MNDLVNYIQLVLWTVSGIRWFRKQKVVSSIPVRDWMLTVLICLGVGMSGVSLYLNYLNSERTQWPADFTKLERVRFQSFENEEVVLDGKDIENCKFKNVTFVFKGKKPYMLGNNEMNSGGGAIRIRVSGSQIFGAGLVYGLLEAACTTQDTKFSCPHVELEPTRQP